MPTRPRFITRIDWVALKAQKQDLLAVITTAEGSKRDSLNGILHLIDSLQDYAVDVMGIDEREVFHLIDE